MPVGSEPALVDVFVAGVHGVDEGVVVGVVGLHDGFGPVLFGVGVREESGGGWWCVCGGHGVEGSHAFGGGEDGEVVVCEAGFFFEEGDVTTGGVHVGFVVCAPVFFEVDVLLEAVLPFGALACVFDGGVCGGKDAAEGGAVQAGLFGDGGKEGVECLCFGVVGEGVGEGEGVVGCGIVGDFRLRLRGGGVCRGLGEGVGGVEGGGGFLGVFGYFRRCFCGGALGRGFSPVLRGGGQGGRVWFGVDVGGVCFHNVVLGFVVFGVR